MKNKLKKTFKKIKLKHIIITIFLLLILNSINLLIKPYNKLFSYKSQIYNISDNDIKFLYDITYKDNINQMIFNTLFNDIKKANEFVIVDMFLLNTNYKPNEKYINLTEQLIDSLSYNNNTKRILITDKINTFYGSHKSIPLENAKNNNVEVYLTDLSKLRQSNILWSSIYYPFLQWIPTKGNGIIKHPFGDLNQKVTLRSFLPLMNFKANHRKTAVMDYNNTYTTFILSANPHNPSSLHTNIGFKIKGQIANDLIITESAITNFQKPYIKQTNENGNINVQLLTEKAIYKSMLKDIDETINGDKIDIAVFYISDRKLIKTIKKAAKRGVTINIILDPNKDAFGFEKNGIPNRQVAYELQKLDNINIRWYDTHGEQFHAKIIVITKEDKIIVHGGSANFTRRNLRNYNLETNVRVMSPLNTKFTNDVISFFQKINQNTLEYEAYKDTSKIKYLIYRFQEFTGLCTF
jgi:cardiolipin synthase A/B